MIARIVVAAMIVAFALLATVHISIVFGLARRSPRWRALAALGVAPLAPWYARREKMNVRAGLWVVLACVYVVALTLASTRLG